MRASILATVLVAGTLLLLFISGIFLAWDIHTGHAAGYHRKRQAQLHVESGFVLYATDSVARVRMLSDSAFALYEEDKSSKLKTECYPWGLYGVVAIATTDGRASSIRMLGKASPGPTHPSLWLRDQRVAVSLAGTTSLFGEVRLPERGLRYAQMYSRSFSGKEVEIEQIKISDRQLPEPGRTARESIEELWGLHNDTLSYGDIFVDRSFREQPLCIGMQGGRVDGDACGRVVIKGDRLVVGSRCRLNDVLIVAASVRIESGFSGQVQIFARDSITLDNGVTLDYPSGVYLSRDTPDGCLRIGDSCEIDGYVVVEKTARHEGLPKAGYIMPESSRVRGLMWIDGIAQVQGSVTGSAWLSETGYFAREGFYSNILYNVNFFATDIFPYPFWQEGPYKKRCVQWLY